MLGAFIRRQRWFAGHDREVARYEILDVGIREGEPALAFVFLNVIYADGETERYSVPLSVRSARTSWQLEHSVVADGNREAGPVQVVDALADPEAGWILWQLLAGGETVPTVHGEVRARAINYVPGEGGPDQVHPLGREQSNSSVVRDNRELFKFFRKLDRETSPEVEMMEALRGAGFAHMAPLLGILEYSAAEQPRTVLAVLQPFVANATDGWALALTSLRDFFAAAEAAEPTGDLEMREVVDEQGSDFTPEAIRLGTVAGDMHLALASDRLPDNMLAKPAGPEEIRAWVDEMNHDLERLLAMPKFQKEGLSRERIEEPFRKMRELGDGGLAIRYHGDFHLGQMLRTDEGWIVLDFEGEPGRQVAARRLRSSPLRDVAGMLRSFDYAVGVALMDRSSPDQPEWKRLVTFGDAWAAVNREAFWEAYLAVVGDKGVLPDSESVSTMLRAFETQKAIYEVDYELGHRPDWVWIPLRYLERPP
jgi:trehalose synthase-fused probable maltokinase